MHVNDQRIWATGRREGNVEAEACPIDIGVLSIQKDRDLTHTEARKR
jgi:hypothetical protein